MVSQGHSVYLCCCREHLCLGSPLPIAPMSFLLCETIASARLMGSSCISYLLKMRLTYGTYIIQMDISETSTIWTLQQQMNSLQVWALDLVKKGRKAELQNLIAAIPVLPLIQELNAKEISLKDLSEIQLKDLKSIASVNDDHVIAAKQKELLTKFKASQKELIKTLSTNLDEMIDDFHEQEKIEDLGDQLHKYMRHSKAGFCKYLEDINATEAQKYAFKCYFELQKQALTNYLSIQKLAFVNLGVTFEKNENVFVRSDNGSNSSGLNQIGQAEQTGKKGGKGGKGGKDQRLRTESAWLMTELKKPERSLVRSARSSVKPEQNQNKAKPRKV